jgi:AAA family ATP:ADP antiporter
MNRWSVGVALMVLPVVDLILSAGFLAVPVLGMAAALSIGDNALNYSINQSAKESLYTPTTPDEKYKAKAFIDMFIQRGAKVLAVGLNLTFAALVSIAAVRWLSLASFVVLAGWIVVVVFAGRRFVQKAAGAEAGDSDAPEEREEVAA